MGATLDCNELVGGNIWTFALNILKTYENDNGSTLMMEDVIVALANCVKRGDIFERTCKEVGLTRFIDVLHWEQESATGAAKTNAICRILYEWVYANPTHVLDIVQRCHAPFMSVLMFDNWPAITKEYVLGMCHMITTDNDEGVLFLITRLYLGAIARYLGRTETVRHKDSVVKLALETVCNIYLVCVIKRVDRDLAFRLCSNDDLLTSLCALVQEHIPLRQMWAMRTIGHMMTLAKRFGFFHDVSHHCEEHGMWDKVNELYNYSPDEEMTGVAKSLLVFQDKTMDYEDRY